jgi:hypothetical protein
MEEMSRARDGEAQGLTWRERVDWITRKKKMTEEAQEAEVTVDKMETGTNPSR